MDPRADKVCADYGDLSTATVVRAASRPCRSRETRWKQDLASVGWVPLQPLEGYTVGVTADRRASEQAELLRRRGARVLDAPTIATAYLGSDERLRGATTALVEE